MSSKLLKLLLAFGLMFSIAACDAGQEEELEIEETPTGEVEVEED
jgi:hypothetical protein